jgi:hypothetical protein
MLVDQGKRHVNGRAVWGQLWLEKFLLQKGLFQKLSWH